MTLFTKICGVTDRDTALVAAKAGTTAIGLVFAESRRRVDLVTASRIADAVRGETAIVAVFKCPDPGEVDEVLRVVGPDLVQADQDHVQGLDVPTLPVYRQGSPATPSGGLFLFEGPVSGVGRQVASASARAMNEKGDMVLAGGLTPANVASVVADIRPYGVDVSSGVEVLPGRKSAALIESFLARARYSYERLVMA